MTTSQLINKIIDGTSTKKIFEGDLMNEWNDGYFTSDTYTYGYYRELNPTFQNFCLLINGFAAPELNESSNHCELGFGQGVAVNFHAAATPGKFYGTDFNPAHAAHANELCNASKCNAKFFDDSFEQMLNRDDLPQFDSISLHGIWSWISTENQKIIVEFAKKFLKPGGVFYNSYNCYPGWAAKSPLRELLILYDKFVGETESNTVKRVDGALNFTKELLSKNPIYARTIPGLEKTLAEMTKENHNYLAHEFFNRDWICMYFTEVAEILSAAKLDFACTAQPLDLLDQANFDPEAIEFLNKIQNPIMKEQAKDYFINRQFRKDIFVRGARKLSQAERRNRLMNMNFVLMTTADIDMKCVVARGEITFNNPDFEKAIEFLRSDNYRPKKFFDLLKNNPSVNVSNIEQIINFLVSTDKMMPCQTEETIKKVKANCDRLNNYLIKRAENVGEINGLASPVIGGAYPIGRFEQIFIDSYKNGVRKSEDLAKRAWKIVESQGQRLLKDGKTVESAEENLKLFDEMAKKFLNLMLPIVKALQIV